MVERQTHMANDIPRRPGRKSRNPQPSTPAQERRQVLAFEMHLGGLTVSAIATRLRANRETILRDIQMEFERRALENACERTIHIAQSVTRYENVILRSHQRLAELESGKWDAAAAREARLCERSIIEAQARIDMALGVVSSL